MSKQWEIHNIKNLEGKVIVVTGGNSGLGYESVKFYASKGAKVILAARSIERGEKAKEEIRKVHAHADIEVMQLDLSSFKSIEQFSEVFKEKYDQLDILLNNAGIMTTPYGLTEDGLEQQIGVNHFGHFALTARLFDVLKKTPDARIVNVSSMIHRLGKMDFNNLFFEGGKGYTPLKAYGRSKLANLLFTYELNRKIKEHGLKMKVVAAHPGTSSTNLDRHIKEGKGFFRNVMPHFFKVAQGAEMGALPGIRASLDSSAKGGHYYGPGGFLELMGQPVLVKSSRAATNKEDAKKLWELSEEITKVHFIFE